MGRGAVALVSDALDTWLRGADGDVAIETHGGASFTYAAWREHVLQIARQLERAGSVVGRVVAVTGDDVSILAGVLATWSLGGVAWVVGSSEREAARVRPFVWLDGSSATSPADAEDPRRLHAALVLSTSGSSGEPKHVVLGHEGLVANVDAITRYLPVAEAPRTGVLVPLTYSYGLVGQALATLRVGGTVLLLRGASAFPKEQWAALVRHRAMGLSSVPAQLRALAEVADETHHLAYVASAGARLDRATVEAMRRAFPRARRFNQYGLTEASPRVCALEDADAPEAFASGSIGRAIDGVQAEVRDGDRLCEVGEVGSLVVRGPNVMRGYLDDEEGTRAALSPYGLVTGDFASVDAEGLLHPAGRRDDLVKIAGERVSLTRVARELERAGECEVRAVEGGRTGTRLVAFVVGDASEARRLSRALPEAWRPSKVWALSAMPRTERGKLDRRLLQTWAEDGRVEERASKEGRTKE